MRGVDRRVAAWVEVVDGWQMAIISLRSVFLLVYSFGLSIGAASVPLAKKEAKKHIWEDFNQRFRRPESSALPLGQNEINQQ